MDTNLINLIQRFRSEDRCRAELERLRWPDGIRCPSCKSDKISRIIKRNQFDCDACRYQFSVTADTLLNDTHLPLWKWFLATYMMCESKKGISACQIQRTLEIGGYKTAWYLCHRIRAAMQEADRSKMNGVLEIDETYIGGKPRRGRPRVIKEVVVGIRQRQGELRFIRAKDIKASTIRDIIHQHVGDDVEVILTDESAVYPWALNREQKTKHKTICHKSEYVNGDVHTNTVESSFSLLKRGIMGTWHRISVKHLPAYLNEVAFRFNNRRNPRLFQDTLKRLLSSNALTFVELTKEAA
jgi:transposase-like protein